MVWFIYNIRTLSVNIKFICTSFRNRQNSEPLTSFSCLFRSEYKWILYLMTMYVYCVYPAMSKKSEDLNKKDRNKRHSSPFIKVVTRTRFTLNQMITHSVSVKIHIVLKYYIFTSNIARIKTYDTVHFVNGFKTIYHFRPGLQLLSESKMLP